MSERTYEDCSDPHRLEEHQREFGVGSVQALVTGWVPLHRLYSASGFQEGIGLGVSYRFVHASVDVDAEIEDLLTLLSDIPDPEPEPEGFIFPGSVVASNAASSEDSYFEDSSISIWAIDDLAGFCVRTEAYGEWHGFTLDVPHLRSIRDRIDRVIEHLEEES